MTRCKTAEELAKLLAQRLAEHYEWDHVIVAMACKDENVFRILAETSQGAERFSHQQPFTAGILGHVYRTGKGVNIPYIPDHELRNEFVSAWPGIQSELCLPIVWDDEVPDRAVVDDLRRSLHAEDRNVVAEGVLIFVEGDVRVVRDLFEIALAGRRAHAGAQSHEDQFGTVEKDR